MYDIISGSFEWNEEKNLLHQQKHGISFEEASLVFNDPHRVLVFEEEHGSDQEIGYHCIGSVDGGVVTVRFTNRDFKVRIIGAGFWRKGRIAYEKKNG